MPSRSVSFFVWDVSIWVVLKSGGKRMRLRGCGYHLGSRLMI